ncbi:MULTISPECIES: hypothetical protein [Halobacterium]|uniref:hypothetical protein n=1 Tax=Halobacterium TaxID=2239 RepID=UPI001962CD20|nr:MULTISPECIES: hypothetical protein [Halobacterium]MCF2165299.1 hypothetical protein [Halobacterium salinarum]MCF2167892.1 hypothetical protein [Halobacterium salinarum]QRY21848.1 hypothetical protein JT689_07365 [Halobacterium sp. GSL-19]WJK63251.1 hypothetical protein QSJ49_08360 [Halobacterium salinarum]
MRGEFADHVYLAALHSPEFTDAFGADYTTAVEPPRVSSLVRSLSDTHAWATRETNVVADLERGDYVVFHREWGVRAVGQVWSVSVDSDDVARHTALTDPAGGWGVVTLTNVQPALDHVSLKSLGIDDVRTSRSLYRLSNDGTTADLSGRYRTAARFVEELVENPLAFDVPPGGTPPDRRPAPPGQAGGGVSLLDTPVEAHLDALDRVRATAWRVLALGVVLLAATLGVVERYRVAPEEPFAFTPAVWVGVGALAVGAALATGVVVHGSLRPRPGLPTFTREQTGAVERAGVTDRDSDAAGHAAATAAAYCSHIHAITRRLGAATGTAAVGVLAGAVYLAYGLGAQVTTAIRPLSVVAFVGFPALIVAALGYAFAVHTDHRLRSVSVGELSASLPAVPRMGAAVTARVRALTRRLFAFAERHR